MPGRRATGGSFESGPSTIAVGVSRGTVRRGRVGSSRFGGTPGHGKRYGREPDLEVYRGRSTVAKLDEAGLARASRILRNRSAGATDWQRATRSYRDPIAQRASDVYASAVRSPESKAIRRRREARHAVSEADTDKRLTYQDRVKAGLPATKPNYRVAKFDATSVLSRTGKLGEALQGAGQTLKTGIKAGQTGGQVQAGSSMGAGGKALVATGQKLGQATATPVRAATTGGAIGAAGTAATMGAMSGQKDPNQVGKGFRDGPTAANHAAAEAFGRRVGRKASLNRGKLGVAVGAAGGVGYERNHRVRKAASERERGVMVTRMHGSSPRNYDPEAHRQRRLGAAQAAANIGGGAALTAGAHHVSTLNRKAKVTARDGVSTGLRPAMAIDRKGGKLVGAGIAGLAAGEKIRRHANDPRNRAWR